MLKGISRELLESFNLFEADNPDGTDNDDGEKVLPSDVQHGFKSKIKSKDVINPLLQELEIKNTLVKPVKVDESLVSYRKIINGKYIDVMFFDEDYSNIWDLSFTVNDQFSSYTNKKIMFQVYQFVFDCLFSFIQTYEPDKIKFNAFVEKQDEIYELFLKQLGRNINNLGYDISKNDIYYFLTRKENLTELKINFQNVEPLSVENNYIRYTNIIDNNDVFCVFCKIKEIWEFGFAVNQKIRYNREKLNKDLFDIYNYVFNCLYNFIIDYKPEVISFEGVDDEQNKIYDLFIKNLTPKINNLGYNISKKYDKYFLTRKENLTELKISDNDISPSNTTLTNGISTFEYNTKIEDDEVKVLITLEPDDYASIGFSVNLSTNIPTSGNKNSMKIYNFVISSIYSFIKEYSPKGLYFVGASDKHEEIYNTLGKLLQRDLKSKGYVLIQDEFSGLYVISKDNDLEEMKKYAGL